MSTSITLGAVAVLCSLIASPVSAQDCSRLLRLRQTTISIQVDATVEATGAIERSEGTGVIVSESGYVLTNSHIFHFDPKLGEVTINTIKGSVGTASSSGREMTLVGEEIQRDVALLRFRDAGVTYQPARIGISRSGEAVCAFGYPITGFHVTRGTTGFPSGPSEWWTTDIVTNPGESGSPMFDAQGRIVGLRVAGRDDVKRVYYFVPIHSANNLLRSVPDLPAPASGPWRLTFSGSYSFLWLTPNLPRGLTAHDVNHPQDVAFPPFLRGFAGPTPLGRVTSHVLEVEGGVARRQDDSTMGFLFEAIAKLPLKSAGRTQIQQVNDARDPSTGSFIYTKVERVSPAFGGRAGVSIHPAGWQRTGKQLLLFGDVGVWNMRFEKGWYRFAIDQPEWTVQATGLETSPHVRFLFVRKGYTLHLTGGATLIHFTYDSATGLPAHWSVGASGGGGIVFQPRLQ
jgi:hypothetical protein